MSAVHVPPLASRIVAALRDVPDFPRPGILFKDITPLLANPALVGDVISAMCSPFLESGVTHVLGIESRGFLFGVPAALELHAAFVPARKPGKLPYSSLREPFALEYGTDALEVHTDAFTTGARVLVVDDVLATGGTIAAAGRLVTRLGGTVAGVAVVATIDGLRNEELLLGQSVHSLVTV